ncbi:MAG: exodeoxyribonuclease VII large subunit [Planctomycetes bacterium]|nr:exodeoxyribonuclease VII large subunit [Planctomycetota bacterium]
MQNTQLKTQAKPEKDTSPKVIELLKRIKSFQGEELADIQVSGKVSKLEQTDSGHRYFMLGEGKEQIKCVLFADKARNLNLKMKNGWQMSVSGSVVIDKKANSGQIIADNVEIIGMSGMQMAITQLKDRLHEEKPLESSHETPITPVPKAQASGGVPLPVSAPGINKNRTQEEEDDAVRDEKLGVARLSIISNTVLIIGKLAVGLFTGSVSVVSEGIHSGMDLLAAIIAYFSVRAAAVPPDKEHKFGHGKIENISGYIEATLIFFASALIIHEAIDKLINGTPVEFLGLGIFIMGVSIVLNWIVSKKLMAVAKKYHSAALEADAMHLTTDIYTSLGVLVGLVLVQLTGVEIIDPIVAILVALLIVHAAYELTKRSLRDLCDARLTDQEEAVIRGVLDEHREQYVDYHQLRTRRAGNTCFIDLHVVVKKESYIDEGHKLSKHLERDLAEAFPSTEILIQVEPCDEKCTLCPKKKDCQPG